MGNVLIYLPKLSEVAHMTPEITKRTNTTLNNTGCLVTFREFLNGQANEIRLNANLMSTYCCLPCPILLFANIQLFYPSWPCPTHLLYVLLLSILKFMNSCSTLYQPQMQVLYHCSTSPQSSSTCIGLKYVALLCHTASHNFILVNIVSLCSTLIQLLLHFVSPCSTVDNPSPTLLCYCCRTDKILMATETWKCNYLLSSPIVFKSLLRR